MKSPYFNLFRRWKPYVILKLTEWWDSGILLSIMHRLKKPPNMRAWSATFPWTPRMSRWVSMSERRPSRMSVTYLSMVISDNNGLQLFVQRRSWPWRITREYYMEYSRFRNTSTLDTRRNDMYASVNEKKPFLLDDRIFVLFADEGIYNTYILDTDYESWALIMHCAEKAKSTRYLSALLLSRERELGMNVINYLRWQFWMIPNVYFSSINSNVGFLCYREKLPQYDIDLSFMFPITQDNCGNWK